MNVPEVFMVDQGVHDAEFYRGLELFNAEKFFDAHEVLEDVWRPAPASERKFLQGLIQVAVAFHHHSRGNLVGCRSLLARASRNLSHYSSNHGGLNLGSLLGSLSQWRDALETGERVPALPKLEISREGAQ
jgi:predicted metal-dependent hydrolase